MKYPTIQTTVPDVPACRDAILCWMSDNKITYRELEKRCGIANSNLNAMLNVERTMGVISGSCRVHGTARDHGPQKSPASIARINAQTESTDRELLELICSAPCLFWTCPVCVAPKIKWEHKTDGRYSAVCLACGRTNRDRPITKEKT